MRRSNLNTLAPSGGPEIDETHDTESIWDGAAQHLHGVYGKLAGTPQEFDRRGLLALLFADRVDQRTSALSSLFHQGLYSEALIIVRTGLEDWVNLSWVMSDRSDTRLEEYVNDANKLQATTYLALRNIVGQEAAQREMPDLEKEVLELVDAEPRARKVNRNLCDRSKSVGLGDIYEFAYRLMSELGHGNLHALMGPMQVEENVVQPRAPSRDLETEQTWGMWAWWFHLRTLTVAGHELGQDLENLSDHLLGQMNSMDLSPRDQIVMLKESR